MVRFAVKTRHITRHGIGCSRSAEVASWADEMFDAGIDVVILALNVAHDGGTVEALGAALADMN
jgi:hypothetical protein